MAAMAWKMFVSFIDLIVAVQFTYCFCSFCVNGHGMEDFQFAVLMGIMQVSLQMRKAEA